MRTNKRLYKSEDPVLFGVCGGIAEYLELDPTLIRILAVIVVLAGFGMPIVAYLVATLLMPKRSDEDPNYIDVKPTPSQPSSTSASAATASATAASAASAAASATSTTASYPYSHSSKNTTMPPGCAYTACNPVAFDAAMPAGSGAGAASASRGTSRTANAGSTPSSANSSAATPSGQAGAATANPNGQATATAAATATADPHLRHRIRTGVILGILLVGIGCLALFDTFLGVPAWTFWPLLIIVLGFVLLCTPGNNGWSLARAGHAISLITVGFALQLLMFGIITHNALGLSLLYLWPALLVTLGLSIIGSATNKSIFKLLGSLFFSATLLFGIWNFGNVAGPLRIDLPGDRVIRFAIPEPPDFLSHDSISITRDGIFFNH
ncbi:MAG: PspC domain-containing protein [Coriobacteriales bacterium]|jgi:phage shock protein PspC (stress-responsive transcriptional regulator)|nr:PspC domain-containing protein [Coriobacteriales bacterium]